MFGLYKRVLERPLFGAAASGRLTVPAVYWTHGTADGLISNVRYDDDLEASLSDFDKDIRAVTGQTDPVDILMYQTSTFGGYRTTEQRDSFRAPLPQVAAARRRGDPAGPSW